MKLEKLEEKTQAIEGCTFKLDKSTIIVIGKKGELKREFIHPTIKCSSDGNTLVFSVLKPTKREKKLIFAFKSHIKNMMKGVTEGYLYKLKVCSGHFPMTTAFKNGIFEVKNFIGETIPRKLEIPKGVSVTINGDEILVDGIDKEITSQTAASIEQLTRRTGFDKRIFQDGIWLIEKDGKHV